jgi:hypothetical protein
MLKESKAASVSMNERFICVETYSGRGLMGRDPGGVCEFHGLDVPESILGDSLRRALEASRWMTMEEYPVFFDGEHSKQVNQAWIERAIERFGSRTDVAEGGTSIFVKGGVDRAEKASWGSDKIRCVPCAIRLSSACMCA